jgi:hypothetical protein
MFYNTLHRLKYRLLYNNPLVWFKKCFLARRILKSAPQPVPIDAEFEIHVLACSKDFLCLLWAVRSFYFFSGPIVSLTIHDDGSLQAWHFQILGRLFPGSRVIPKSQSDDEATRFLASFPKCQLSRNQSVYMIKVFDFPFYSRGKRIILLDSDVLFFEKPVDLLSSGQESLFNSDIWTNYLFSTKDISSRFGITIPEKINIGLGVMSKECFDLALTEKMLEDPGLGSAPFFIDQTVIAMLAARNKIRLLGPEYQMSLSRGLANTVSKHYTRLIRHLLFLEGLPRLTRAGILE